MAAPRDVSSRPPGFLQKPQDKAGVATALFPRADAPPRNWQASTASRQAEEQDAEEAAAAAAAAEAAALAAAAQAEQLALVNARLGGAVEQLAAAAERLASEARSDAVEVAFFLARRILEIELATSVDSMAALARSAVRRLGESRRIELRLSPADAGAMTALLAERGPGVLTSLTSAQIEVVPDPALQRGDCVVEGDSGTVDGRLDTRLDELRRALAEELGESP
jgi:flagellar assembly protein FliH